MNKKITCVIFSLCLVLALALERNILAKVIGGQDASIEELPYQCSLETALLGIVWQFTCGATIVGHNSVLTTASCVYNVKVENVRIRSGSSYRGEGVIHRAVDIVVHPNNTEYFINDIAFITVEPGFTYHATVQPIPLAMYEPPVGALATVSGWGRTDESVDAPSSVLQKASVPIVNRTLCQQQYEKIGNVTESMICAGYPDGGVDSCAGDTGGPLQIDGVLIGLVSWGYRCAQPGYPAVYTNTVTFNEWIQEMLNSTAKGNSIA